MKALSWGRGISNEGEKRAPRQRLALGRMRTSSIARRYVSLKAYTSTPTVLDQASPIRIVTAQHLKYAVNKAHHDWLRELSDSV